MKRGDISIDITSGLEGYATKELMQEHSWEESYAESLV